MSLKQTHLYKVMFKPGSFAPIGEKNKIGSLYLERAIGDWLVAKGLATTEDNCRYYLDCCSNTSIIYNEDTGEFCLVVGNEETCVTLNIPTSNVFSDVTITIDGVDYPPGTDLNTIITELINYINSLVISTVITTDNGLSGTGSLANPAKLGGTLIENTTVDGDGLYNMSFTDLTQFLVTVLGSSSGGTLRVGGSASLPSFLSHYKNSDPNVYARVELDFNDVFGLHYLDGNGLIGFRIFPDETDAANLLGLRTKAIRDTTATLGQVPVLNDPVEGTFEWGNVEGEAINIPGPYDDDSDAASNSVSVGKPYYLSDANPYGMTEGIVKIRIA